MLSMLTVPGPVSTSSATASKPKSDAKLKSACQEFAGELFSEMLKEMRKTVPDDQLIGDSGHQQEIFTEMMDNKVAQDMSKQGGTNGLGAQLYNQLSGHRAFNVTSAATPTIAAAVTPMQLAHAGSMVSLAYRKSSR